MSKKKSVLLLLLAGWVCFCMVWFFFIYKKEEKKSEEGLSAKSMVKSQAATVSGTTDKIINADSGTALINLADTTVTDVKQQAAVATGNDNPLAENFNKQAAADSAKDNSMPVLNAQSKNKIPDITAPSNWDKKKVSVYYFYPNSDKKIKNFSQKILAKLQQYPALEGSAKITITGHTDYTGPAAYNYHLGLQRAERIKRLLVKRGIAAERIIVLSKGEEQPVTSNKTQQGRAKNRRVEINFTLS
jgi:outer membrane protein OmpA-like peptidoglycan-associated protein